LKIENTTKVLPVHFCIGCGACCRNFAYIPVSQKDVGTLETFTGIKSEEFTDKVDKSGEKRFMKFQDNGDCIFLEKNDDGYFCSVYEARPETCRRYPSTDIQIKTCNLNSGR
jgi:Fe-S-cluster containining protein